jgi:hypothetical protein
MLTNRRTDGKTADMTELTAAFRNFANAPKNKDLTVKPVTLDTNVHTESPLTVESSVSNSH